jgi:hypothetical protein
MESVNTVRRRVSIRNGMSIVKEVESARARYQSSKINHSPRGSTNPIQGDYQEADELIKRLNSVNLALSTK